MAKRRRHAQNSTRTVGWVGLARAVLLHAVQDATADKDKDVRWSAHRFIREGRMFGIYCELAEWEPDYIRQNVERLLSSGEAG